ncbi:MAG: glucodextranase DOMON-like domain-containing protein, partial [Bacillota bacterium]
MKGLQMLGFIVILLLLLTPSSYAKQQVHFEMEDPLEDDYGSGTYIYPGNEQFRNHLGLFD